MIDSDANYVQADDNWPEEWSKVSKNILTRSKAAMERRKTQARHRYQQRKKKIGSAYGIRHAVQSKKEFRKQDFEDFYVNQLDGTLGSRTAAGNLMHQRRKVKYYQCSQN